MLNEIMKVQYYILQYLPEWSVWYKIPFVPNLPQKNTATRNHFSFQRENFSMHWFLCSWVYSAFRTSTNVGMNACLLSIIRYDRQITVCDLYWLEWGGIWWPSELPRGYQSHAGAGGRNYRWLQDFHSGNMRSRGYMCNVACIRTTAESFLWPGLLI